MHARRAALAALFVFSLAILAFGGVPAPAASTGLAWDSVTRLMTNADPTSLQPGSFDADYAAAAAAPPPNGGGGGGIFAKYKQAIAQAQNFAQLMKAGLAERHYVAGSKERTDQVAAQTASIVDCSARTVTTLDLKAKTYRVEPMDASSSGGSSGGGGDDSGPGGKNDVRLAITIANTALGSQRVGGLPANGYRSNMTFTETSSSGQSQTQNADVLGYYSSYADPTMWCARPDPGLQNGGGQGLDMMAGYARLMRALSTTGDPHFSIKQSGPPLPVGKLAMYSAMMFSMQGHGATFLTERGDVRPIEPDDAAFRIPSGFAQQQ